MKNITYAANIPLIGGLPLGAEKVFGKPPEFVAGYNGFQKHDSQYMNWLNNTNGHGIKYYNLDECNDRPQANIIVSTPPCSGLSSMNCAKCKSKSGSGAAVNDWMYRSLVDNIDRLGAKVVITENAPALYSDKGKGVAENLTKLANERGYSVSFFKTSTHLHGIPQQRIRTFFFAWNTKTAPILEWFVRPHVSWRQYMTEIPKDAGQHNVLMNDNLLHDCGYFKYMSAKGLNVRDALYEGNFKTTFAYVYKNGLLPDAIEWFKENDMPNFQRRAEHAKKKFDSKMGIWDGSVCVPGNTFNAFVGRNAFQTIHPTEDRSLSIREGMHMMAMPHNYELLGKGSMYYNMVCQNVPVCTAADMVGLAVKFLKGELPDSGLSVVKQNNIKQTIDVKVVTAKFDHI